MEYTAFVVDLTVYEVRKEEQEEEEEREAEQKRKEAQAKKDAYACLTRRRLEAIVRVMKRIWRMEKKRQEFQL